MTDRSIFGELQTPRDCLRCKESRSRYRFTCPRSRSMCFYDIKLFAREKKMICMFQRVSSSLNDFYLISLLFYFGIFIQNLLKYLFIFVKYIQKIFKYLNIILLSDYCVNYCCNLMLELSKSHLFMTVNLCHLYAPFLTIYLIICHAKTCMILHTCFK